MDIKREEKTFEEVVHSYFPYKVDDKPSTVKKDKRKPKPIDRRVKK